MDDLLQQGIAAYKAGNQDKARGLFIALVRQNPNSEQAWGWMSSVCNTDRERIHCVKQVVRINPNNEKARQHLEQLLTPTPSLAPEPQPSPVTSVPVSPVPSASKTSKNTGFTQTQLFVLLGLVATLFLMVGAAFLFLFTEKDQAVVVVSPTSLVALSVSNTPFPTQVPPTATLIPTYEYKPTFTALPSPTSFVVGTLFAPTPRPQQAQSSSSNPPVANSGSSCSSQLDYAAAMHQYYLDAIDYVHAPLINLYQSWIDEAARNRDALGMVEAQRKLDNEKAQVDAEKSAENKRYKAEKARINASCQ